MTSQKDEILAAFTFTKDNNREKTKSAGTLSSMSMFDSQLFNKNQQKNRNKCCGLDLNYKNSEIFIISVNIIKIKKKDE